MRQWLYRLREEARKADADALLLIAENRLRAYSEARQRQQDAHSAETFAHWGRVAIAVAQKTGKPIGVDTATRIVGDEAAERRPRWPRGRTH
jgi:hypothetical protein